MKKVWRIKQNPHLLLSKVYHSSRLPNHPQLLSQRQLSWGRRGILFAKKLFESQCRWKVGNGRNIGVTTHKWLPERHPLFRDEISLATVRNIKVNQLILPNNQGWDIRKINLLFEPSTARHIKSIELPDCPTVSDVHYWPLTKSGAYSTKSGLHIAFTTAT